MEGATVGIAATSETNIVPMRALSDKEALAWLVGKARTETSTAALARDWLWSASKVRRRLSRWSSVGLINVKPGLGGRTVITSLPEPVASSPAGSVATVVTRPEPVASAPAGRQGRAIVTSVPVAAIAPEPTATPEADTATETAIVPAPSVIAVPQATAPALRARTTGFVNVLAYAVAVSLAGIAAYFS